PPASGWQGSTRGAVKRNKIQQTAKDRQRKKPNRFIRVISRAPVRFGFEFGLMENPVNDRQSDVHCQHQQPQYCKARWEIDSGNELFQTAEPAKGKNPTCETHHADYSRVN